MLSLWITTLLLEGAVVAKPSLLPKDGQFYQIEPAPRGVGITGVTTTRCKIGSDCSVGWYCADSGYCQRGNAPAPQVAPKTPALMPEETIYRRN